MIRSFSDQGTEDLYHGRRSRDARRIAADIHRTALRKLDMINAALSVEDLRSPPGNRLEALRGDLKGYFSTRINDQWRIVLQWNDSAADNVEIMDYHR